MYDNQKELSTAAGCVEVRRPTLTERLKEERASYASRLAELDAAISALEANPQVQVVLDLVQKVSRL